MNIYKDRIIFGCHSIATLPSYFEANRLLTSAYRLGIHRFDTAPLYSRGYSESLLSAVFKNFSEVRITTKIGNYAVPSTKIPVSLAISFHALYCIFRRHSFSQNTLNTPNQLPHQDCNIQHLQNHFNSSQHRLAPLTLQTLLLHEISPWSLSSQNLEQWLAFCSENSIPSIGYGGEIPKELLQNQVPDWLKVLQVPYPLADKELANRLCNLIAKNPSTEFRLFGFFRANSSTQHVFEARSLLSKYPNTSILFSCRSPQRLIDNLSAIVPI